MIQRAKVGTGCRARGLIDLRATASAQHLAYTPTLALDAFIFFFSFLFLFLRVAFVFKSSPSSGLLSSSGGHHEQQSFYSVHT